MKKKGPRQIPDFSTKKNKPPVDLTPEAKVKPESQAPIGVAKHMIPTKSGRRGG